ncbi:MAG: AAA family ATPase [Thermoanaerobaculia bacterium]
MHRLDRIQIAGFKSIRDQTLDLRSLNVLIGANGAGKSNFIEVFRLLHEIVDQNLQLFVARSGGGDRLLHFGNKATVEMLFHLWFSKNAYRCRLVPAVGDALVFGEERIFFQLSGEDSLNASLGVHSDMRSGDRETMLLVEGEERNQSVVKAIQSWEVYHFQDTTFSARVKQTSDLDDNIMLRADAGNLAPFLYRLQETDPGTFRNISETVRLVAPFFGGFDLRPDRLNSDKIRLEWHEKGTDTYFDAHALSDGTLRFVSLATLLLQSEPPTMILIDEPELGLHPYAIAVLADLLRAAADRTQVIVSTQSVTLVNQLSPEDVIVVDREGGESVFRRPSSADLENWLDGYSLGELWEKNVLGGRPRS